MNPDTAKAGGKFPLVIIPVIIAIALAVFWPLTSAPFLFDDIHAIRDNPFVAERLSPIFFILHPESGDQIPGTPIRPLLTFSYAIDYHLGGGKPFLFHLTNLLIHAFNAILVVFITRKTRNLKSAAPLAGIIFLLLPINTALIGYASNRSTLLSATFYLAALAVFASAFSSGDDSLKKHSLRAAAITVLYIMGLLVKETVATLPAALVLWAWAFPEDKPSRGKLRMTALAAGSLLVCLAVYFIYRRAISMPTLFPSARPWPVWSYLAAQARVYFTYLSLTALPVNLSIEHQSWMPKSGGDLVSLSFLLSLFGLGAILAASFFLRRRSPEFSFAAPFSILYLLPTSSVIPLMMVTNENRPYLSALLLVWPLMLLHDIVRKNNRAAAPAMIVVIAVLLAAGSLGRAKVYQSPIAFFKDGVKNAPQLARPLVNLGIAYEGYGRFDVAELLFRRALQNEPCSAAAMTNIANLTRGQGREKEAEDLYRRALQCDPYDTAAMLNLADVLNQSGRQKEAAELIETARRLAPNLPVFRVPLH